MNLNPLATAGPENGSENCSRHSGTIALTGPSLRGAKSGDRGRPGRIPPTRRSQTERAMPHSTADQQRRDGVKRKTRSPKAGLVRLREIPPASIRYR